MSTCFATCTVWWYTYIYIVFGIHFRTTYKIGIQISAATRSFLPILGPCVGQRNITLHTEPDLDTPSTSDSNAANVKSPK